MAFLPMLRSLLILFVCLAFAARADDPRELHLLCWTEYVPQKVIDGFSKQASAHVLMENYNSNAQMLAALRAKPGYFDLIQPSGFYAETLEENGGLEALDLSRIPNVRNLDPRLRALGKDTEGRFSVPWMAGTVGIVVNTERVHEPVRNWADVFDGSHAGRIVVVNDPREMVAWALAALDLPMTSVDDASLARVAPVLEKWLPQVRIFDSDSPSRALLSGEADLGIVWSGEAALLWQRDRKFQYILPERGAHRFVDRLAIPQGAPHHALAEEFINYCLDPEVSALISAEYPYTNPNLAARHLLTSDQLANPASYPPGDPALPSLRNVGNTPDAVDAFVRHLRERIGK
jgi:spermidine/putrescine transport system permease protein